jgi:peptide/nickel transport system ATP-binding protein/oligopeptide transport system ATP-binding protein
MAAVPVAAPRLSRIASKTVLAGELPSPLAPPPGCAFHPRCPIAIERCRREVPHLGAIAGGRRVACHRAAPDAAEPLVP